MNAALEGRSRSGTACDDRLACAILEDLVRTPSISGDEARAVAVFVARGREIGLAACVDDAGNAVATRHASAPDPVEIVLLGHIDTVPGFVPARVESGVLHGRGAVDAKGPLAAMLVAAATAEVHPRVAIHVIAAVGEETPESPGARHIVPRYRPAACIIGEPSGADGFALGYKGRLLVRARFERAHSHSAGPAGSAADAAFAWWGRVNKRVARLNHGVMAAFDSIQASLRDIGSVNDGLVDSATLVAGFRLPPTLAPETLESLIRTIDDPPSGIEFRGHTPAFRGDRGSAVAAAITAAIRAEGGTPRPLLKTGTADMNIVGPAWGCPIVAYGPGDSALDHTPHEHIRLDEYLRGILVLRRALALLSERVVTTADGGA